MILSRLNEKFKNSTLILIIENRQTASNGLNGL